MSSPILRIFSGSFTGIESFAVVLGFLGGDVGNESGSLQKSAVLSARRDHGPSCQQLLLVLRALHAGSIEMTNALVVSRAIMHYRSEEMQKIRPSSTETHL